MTIETVTGSTACASLDELQSAPARRRGLGGARGQAHGVAVLGVAHDLARDAAARGAAARHSSHTMPLRRPSYRWTCSPISGVRPQSTQRSRSASSAPRPRLQQEALELLDVRLRQAIVTRFRRRARAPARLVGLRVRLQFQPGSIGLVATGREGICRARATSGRSSRRLGYPETAADSESGASAKLVMIATSFSWHGAAPAPMGGWSRPASRAGREQARWSYSVRTRHVRGRGLLSLPRCGYVLTLGGSDALSDCPSCGGSDFVRASLFSTERCPARRGTRPATAAMLSEPAPVDRDAQLARGASADRAARRVPLLRGRRRVAHRRADARVDAHRAQPRGRRALRRPDRLAPPRADRAPARRRARARRPQPQRRVRQRRAGRGAGCSSDGDEIIVGRYRLSFLDVPAVGRGERASASTQAPARHALAATAGRSAGARAPAA